MEHQFLGRPVGCIVTIPTALLQLHTITNHVTFMVQRRVRALFFCTGGLRDAKAITTKFAADSVAICAYGLRQNSFLNPDTEFRKYGRKFLEPTIWRGIEQSMVILFPAVADFLKLK